MTTPTEFLKTKIKLCLFDQYGTVVDMQRGLTAVATPYLAAKGWPGRPDAFVTWWRRTHFESASRRISPISACPICKASPG